MTRLYVFADEAGDFEFSRKPNVSRYFILCTVTMRTCKVGDEMLALRRELAWHGRPLDDFLHASTDKQVIRDAVFDLICQYPFHVQATIMEKSKARPQVRISRARFYKYGWLYHFRYGMKPRIGTTPEVLVTAATIGTKKERLSFRNGVDDVMRQTVNPKAWAATFCLAATDPCVQIADYCAWAIQRKWEHKKDERSYDLI